MGAPSNGIDTIILAGGKIDPALKEATGVEHRALIPLGRRTMLQRVVDALVDSVTVGTIYVVGDVPVDPAYTVVEPREDLFSNLQAGIKAVRKANPDLESFLAVTADIPFLSAGGVDDFVHRAQQSKAQLCYPIIPMESYNRIFSAMKRTTLKLRDGHFTGGNIMFLDAELMAQRGTQIREAYAARKDVLKLGAILGGKLLFKIVLSQSLAPNLLIVGELEAGVSKVLGEGYRAKAIVTEYPEIGTDVDKIEDVTFARKWFADRDALEGESKFASVAPPKVELREELPDADGSVPVEDQGRRDGTAGQTERRPHPDTDLDVIQ